MSALLQAAEEKLAAKREKERDDAAKRREEKLDRIIEKFYDEYAGFGRLTKEEGVDIPMPERSDFTHVPCSKVVQIWGGGSRHTEAHGWQVEVDGLQFLFDTSEYSGCGLYLLHECPKCGVTGASSFFDLADVASLVKNGPKDYTHSCLERETRAVAYALGSAARDLKLSVSRVYEEAVERHYDLIHRLTSGR